MPLVERLGKKDEFFGFEAADGPDRWGKDRVDPVIAEICLSSHVVGNKKEFYWPFDWLELQGRVVRLFVGGHKPHVSSRNANNCRHVGVASNCWRGPR